MSTTTSQSNPAESRTSRLQAISVTVSCLLPCYSIKYFTTNARYQFNRISFDKFLRTRDVAPRFARSEPSKRKAADSPSGIVLSIFSPI